MCSVTKVDSMILVEKIDENKISIKIFHGGKTRKTGVHWFKVDRNVEFLTVDINKGDVYSGHLQGYQKKRKVKKQLRKNYFNLNPILQMRNKMMSKIPLPREEAVQIVDTAIKVFIKSIRPEINEGQSLNNELIKFYLEKKGIKYPNNFELYFNGFGLLPKLKNLRKHDMKLVDAFMTDNQLKGGVIKRALHQLTEGLNVSRLKSLLNIFPNEWILQDVEFVRLALDFDTQSVALTVSNIGEHASKSELRAAFNCFKLALNKTINSGTLYDHCEFYVYLKMAGENIKWKSKDLKSFNEEHLDFADLYEFYKKGFYTRIYPQSLYDAFKIPIQHMNEVYYPVILTNSDEYNSESANQSNCVKTYIGRPSSIIISLRKESTVSNERATVEYQIFKKEGDFVTYNRPQSLGKFNSRLTEDWNEPLRLLDERIKNFIGDGKDIDTVKIEKLLHNHKKLYSDSDWAENGFLFWTYNLIDKNKTYHHLNYNIDHLF
jgi:hypothetical protein